MRLKKQTLSGLIWSFGDTILVKGGTFAAQIVLARLLGPAEFGLVGMMAIFIAVGTTLVDSGMSASLIRTPDADKDDFNTVFYTNLLLSIIVYGIMFLLAPAIAQFYRQPVLISVIRLYCISFLIMPFSAVQVAILLRQMKFKKLMLLNIPGTLLGIATGITLGYRGYGVWSIVGMLLVTQGIQSLLIWATSSWKPSFSFSREKWKIHFHFGYKLMLSGLLNTIFENIYNIIIGRTYNVKVLGYYERAQNFNQYPVQTLTSVITKVSYPMLTNIASQRDLVNAVYRKVITATFFIVAPLMLGAAALAEPLFLLVLGPQWLPAVPLFQILCFSSILYPIHSFNINVLKVYGRSDLFLKVEIIKKILMLIVVIVSYKFGIYALVFGAVVSSFAALMVNTYYSRTMIHYSIKEQVLDMLPTFATALVMALAMKALLLVPVQMALLLKLIITGVLGAFLYLLLNSTIKSFALKALLSLKNAKV